MTLEEIEKRLEEATGEDREIDAALEVIAWPSLSLWPRSEYGGWVHPTMGLIAPPSYFTSSLDASIRLVERMRGREFLKEIIEAAANEWWSRPNFKSEEFPRFMCLALIRALRAKEKEHDTRL